MSATPTATRHTPTQEMPEDGLLSLEDPGIYVLCPADQLAGQVLAAWYQLDRAHRQITPERLAYQLTRQLVTAGHTRSTRPTP